MIRRKEERTAQIQQNMRGGIGEVVMTLICENNEELSEKGRLFSHASIAPGNSIGLHTHKGDSETYYFLKGKGEYNDNGKITEVFPGDLTICKDGQSHSILNTGDEPLEFIALILFT